MPTLSSSSPVLAFEPKQIGARVIVVIQCAISLAVPLLIPVGSLVVRVTVAVLATTAVLLVSYSTGLIGARRVVGVIWQQSGDWCLRQSDKSSFSPGWQLGRSQVTALYMSLQWTSSIDNARRRARLIMFRGELPSAEWRRWRMRLRHASGVIGGSSTPGL